MLNELYVIYRGLESIGVPLEIKHNDIHEPGTNNITFRVLLDDAGQVSNVKLMTKKQIKECWSLGNKQTQFPAVKVKRPLVAGGHNEYVSWKEKNTRPDETDYRNMIDCMCLNYFTPDVYCDEWPKYRKTILERKKITA